MRANFVPVALNADRLPATPDGAVFKSLLTRWPQGLWIITPTGKTIGFHYHTPTPGDTYKQNVARWTAATVALLDAATTTNGPRPPRQVLATNPFPDRGVGFTPAGGVRLAVTVTATRGDRPDGPPVQDSFTLTATDWAAVAPPAGITTGMAWTLPATVSTRFAPVLSPLTDSIFVPRPADVTATLTGRVIRTSDGVRVVAYRGEWASRHRRDGDPKLPVPATLTGDGIGVFDAATGQPRNWLWVLTGTYQKGPGAPVVPTAAVVEWRAD